MTSSIVADEDGRRYRGQERFQRPHCGGDERKPQCKDEMRPNAFLIHTILSGSEEESPLGIIWKREGERRAKTRSLRVRLHEDVGSGLESLGYPGAR